MTPRRVLSVPAQVDLSAAWEALRRPVARASGAGSLDLRLGRLLHVPFWIEEPDPARPAGRRRRVVPAADLGPVGLPSAGRGPRRRRLEVTDGLPAARQGPPIPAENDARAVVVDATPDPEGLDPAAAWTLLYYPVWSFQVAIHQREQFLVVDAVTGRPIGAACGVRWAPAGAAAGGAMLALFWLSYPIMGAGAALPAWLGALAVLRTALRSGRA